MPRPVVSSPQSVFVQRRHARAGKVNDFVPADLRQFYAMLSSVPLK